MSKIKIFDVYAFDILNKLNSKENGTYSVQVLEIQKRFLKSPIYTVISLETKQIIRCTKDLLTPIPSNSELHIYVRHPDDCPTITDTDIRTVNGLLANMDTNSPVFTNLRKLKLKLDYYSKVRNI